MIAPEIETLSRAVIVSAPLVEAILPEEFIVTSPDDVVLKLIAPLLLVNVFPIVNPVAPTKVNVAPVPVVKLPLVDKVPPVLCNDKFPVPVDKFAAGNVNVPVDITVKG